MLRPIRAARAPKLEITAAWRACELNLHLPRSILALMLRRLLQLLLALTLILNGIAAPWAMAGMLGGHHAQHGAQRTMQAELATAVSDPHAHHDHASHHAGALPDSASNKADSCCDSVICQCGCVLPPALSVMMVALAPPPEPALRVQRRRSHIAPHHPTPLLRPPAP